MSRFRAGDVVRTPGNQIFLVYEVVNEQVNKYAPPPGAGLAIMADRDGTPKGYGGHQYTRVTLYPDDPREAIEVIGHNAEVFTEKPKIRVCLHCEREALKHGTEV